MKLFIYVHNHFNTSSFHLFFSDLGLAADVGALQRLPKIIGSESLVRELVFTGRQFSAQEAKESGFVNRIFDSKEQ